VASFDKQVTVNYSSKQMYDLVNDIGSYSNFIPMCAHSEVHEVEDHKLRATIKIAKGKVGFQFTTVNTMVYGKSIRMKLETGPFKTLEGVWIFKTLSENQCLISLHFDFEFSNRILAGAFKSIFSQLCTAMVDSFTHQAKLRYG
jgi:ribosome-associated toxin RatA of RatAB toxin-antitoxin module